MSHHQSAKPVVAVMAVEIRNERAASLIQSVTARNFQSAQLPRPAMAQHVENVGHRGRDFIAVAYGDGSHTPGPEPEHKIPLFSK